jgi:hypothetical protein
MSIEELLITCVFVVPAEAGIQSNQASGYPLLRA